jgi:uncharacterized protein
VNPIRTQPTLGWAVLLLASVALAGTFTLVHLPAAVLLGCMVAAIFFSSNGIPLQVSPALFAIGQGLLGSLMGSTMKPAALTKVADGWPLFLLATSAVILASALLGWLMQRRKIFPGTTAVWGLAPGAASAMVLMAESYGADVRLVAFMQYTRVAVVTATAALIAHAWSPQDASLVSAPISQSIANPMAVGWTLLVAIGGSLFARRLNIPGGPMVLPLVVCTVLQSLGVLSIELPPPVLVLAYALIGWSIGLRFTRTILLHALRTLPQVLGSIVALMTVGAALAALLFWLAGIDPLTAYLATSPGGADSVVVIAATSAVDAGFVMSMQLARFLMVLVFGPQVSKFVATRSQSG